MKELMIFDAECGDSISSCIDEVIQKRKSSNEDIFLRFNGVTMRVTENDTPESVYSQYNNGLHLQSLRAMEYHGFINHDELKEKMNV